MRRFSVLASPLFACLLGLSFAAQAAEFEILQKNKAFSVKKMKVKVGDSIKFKNEDPFAHNIFSLSDIKSFDLGSYGQGASKSVTFDTAGSVEVECAIHPEMRVIVEVVK